MCPFDEKKQKSVVFSLTYKYEETAYTVFSTPSNPPIIPTPPPFPLLLIIITMSNPSYYSRLERPAFDKMMYRKGNFEYGKCFHPKKLFFFAYSMVKTIQEIILLNSFIKHRLRHSLKKWF